jgi:hypothetical protein
MVNDVRNYSSTTREMSLLGAVDLSAEQIGLDSLQGLPTPPFTLVLSADSTGEEVVLATEISGSNVTITRAQAGTTARSHSAGAKVRHAATGQDMQEFQDHVQAVSGVHGVSGQLVGADSEQVLTNKTISGLNNTVTDLDGATSLAPASVTNDRLAPGIDADTLNGRTLTVSAVAPSTPAEGDLWIDIS